MRGCSSRKPCAGSSASPSCASRWGDYRQALKLLPGAVARLQHQIALAEREAGQARSAAPRYPLTPDQIAHGHYVQRLAFDDCLRNDPRYASVGIDDLLVERLRAGPVTTSCVSLSAHRSTGFAPLAT